MSGIIVVGLIIAALFAVLAVDSKSNGPDIEASMGIGAIGIILFLVIGAAILAAIFNQAGLNLIDLANTP